VSAGSTPGPTRVPPRGGLGSDTAKAVLFGVAIALLALSLVFPWWSESAANPMSASETSTQEYSPITGVTGTCSPGCTPAEEGPLPGPFQGIKTFSSLGLNETGALYEGVLGLTIIGMASAALALVAPFAAPLRARLRSFAPLAAIVASALASGLLAALQPVAYRMDNAATFEDHGAWTAAPSPQTSFWGSCSPGPSNGICTSGWSDSWGPGLGWYLVVGAALVLMAIALLPVLRARRSRGPGAPTEKKDNTVDSVDASSEDAR